MGYRLAVAKACTKLIKTTNILTCTLQVCNLTDNLRGRVKSVADF
jgi:hypothetical protein